MGYIGIVDVEPKLLWIVKHEWLAEGRYGACGTEGEFMG